MHEYELKRGQSSLLAGDGLRRLVVDVLGTGSTEAGKVVAQFGALKKLTTWTDGRVLFVDTEMDPSVEPAVAGETIRRYNAFLERATGYTAKQRAKREQERAKGSR